jgi:ribosomal protein L16 Arg81 hydroxylase
VPDVVVEPGETVFLPLAWWHQVSSLDRCISLSFTHLDLPNVFDFAPEMTFIAACGIERGHDAAWAGRCDALR